MKVATLCYGKDNEWRFDGASLADPQLVIWFSDYARAKSPDAFDSLRRTCPDALIVGCTTNGEIYKGEVMEGACVAAAVRFAATRVQGAFLIVEPQGDARAAGRRLAAELRADGLRGVFVLADAFGLNGSDLVEGIASELPDDVIVSGGMAGDGGALGGSTLAGLDRTPCERGVAAIGFYGEALRIGQGVAGGWDALGPSRHITRASGSVVYELDGQPALEVYERLVGDAGTNARLRHPFCIKPTADSAQDVIWEVVGIDRESNGIVFIDKAPEGHWGQIMRGVDDHLVDGAAEAARIASSDPTSGDALGLMVSCIGRKWAMGQRIGDETEAWWRVVVPVRAWGATSP